MVVILLLYCFLLLRTTYAHPGFDPSNYVFPPLQFSLSSGQTLHPVLASPWTPPPTPTASGSSPSLTGAALSSEENAKYISDLTAAFPSLTGASLSAFLSEGNAAYPTLTGSALSSYISEENAQLISEVTAAYPTLTGDALSSFLTGDAAYPTLTGSALSSYISEEDAVFVSEITAEYPTLTGSALSAFLTDAYAPAIPTLTGSALSSYISAYDAEYASEITAAYPSITGTALSVYISEDNLALTGTAAAAATTSEGSAASASAYASAAPSAGNLTDACGPKIPDPTVEDSCSTPVGQSDTPGAYSVQCLNDTQSSTQVNISSCAYLIPQLCSEEWQTPGEWVWLTANGCSVGSYLPPTSYEGAAPWPNNTQCEQLIYAPMVDGCGFEGIPWNIAAVNLKVLPDDTTKGQAVNGGYGSYVVAERQLRTQ